MKIAVCLGNINKARYTRWVTLPINSYKLQQIIGQLCPYSDDNCILLDYKTKFSIEDLVGCEDIYYLNELLIKLNTSATDKEIQALAEAYSPSLDDINLKIQRGGYKFYADKTLMTLAIEKAKTEPYYNYYRQNGEIEYEKIVDELSRSGYEQTSTGVIQIYGY